MTFILSKQSKVYKKLPFWMRVELGKGIMQRMNLSFYKEALEEIWGKESTLPQAQIERIEYLQRDFVAGKGTVLFSVCDEKYF